MKILFSILVLATMFYACKKNAGTSPNSTTYVKYKINGQEVRMNGEITTITGDSEGAQCIKQAASPDNGFPSPLYAIQGQKGNGKLISLVMVTDSLQTETYNTNDTTTRRLTFIKQESLSYFNGFRAADNIVVRISRHSNGTIDGTFSGTLANAKVVNGTTTYTDGQVTEGEFRNIPVRYSF